MTKRISIIMYVALSFMVLFISIGYASFTDDLTIRGSAEVEIPEGLFITEITTSSTTNIEHYTVDYLQYSTTVDTTIDKKNDTTSTTSSRPGRPGTTTTTTYEGKVVYKITVFNNTKHEYAYRGLFYQTSLSGYNGNGYVSTSASDARIGVVVAFDKNDKVVGPGETLTFTVTYTVGKGMDDDTDWKTLINFQFGINVDSEEAAINAIHSKFLNILNTSTTYQTLVDCIDDKFDGYQEWTSNYIGNVSNAVDADSMAVETLFAGQLNMIINGEVRPASVLIKHENLDWNNYTGDDYIARNESNGGEFYGYGCEMTLYLTTDPLDVPNGLAPVYVTVFTCDRDYDGNITSKWYQIGDTYIGKANIVGYNGEYGGTGSFVTDNWISDAEIYSPTSNFSYSVDQGTTIKTLVQVVDDKAIEELQRLLIDAKELIEDIRYAGIGIEMIENEYALAARYYTLDYYGNPIANQGTTRAQLLPTIRNLNYAIDEARRIIDQLQSKQ